MVETATDTECSFFATTANSYVVVLAQTILSYSVTPIGVVVVLFILRECRVVVNLADIGRSSIILRRVEVCLFQQHCIVVTIQHLITFRLIGTREFQRIGEFRCTDSTTFGGELDDTITAL